MGKSRKSNNGNGDTETSESIDTHGFYYEYEIEELTKSLKGTGIQFDYIDEYGDIHLKQGGTEILLEEFTLRAIISDESNYTFSEIWEAWNKVPQLFRENIKTFELSRGQSPGGYHDPLDDSSLIHLNRGIFENKLIKNTSWDIRETLLHECTHALDYHRGEFGVDVMTLSDNSEKFRKISETELASSYSRALLGKPHFLRENFAEAMMVVASHRIYGQGKIPADNLPLVDYAGSTDIDYSEWVKTHPQLDKLCNDILDCKTWDEVKQLF